MMQQFIDPKTLSRVKDLPLAAKTLAQGFLQGMHHSMQRGVGIEFSQYRIYEPGDDLSKIDWKLFARSDRYFVREAERESDINVYLVLDSSRSMLQKSDLSKEKGSDKKGHWSKFEYARYLLATVAYLAQKQGDAVGLLNLSSEHSAYLPAFSGERHWQKILIQLARMTANNSFPDINQVRAQLSAMRNSGLIFMVSDFHQQNSEIVDLVCQLSNSRTEVVAIQLESQDEIDFPYKGAIRFEDLETKKQLLVSASQVKADYFHYKATYQEQLLTQLAQHKVQHFHANIDKPLDQTLYDFLRVRNKVVR
ncbi:MAG: hypothetical protein ACI9LM_003886 [Alteromonadaceae bacterium]|jgi:uncharacterized protein (DUF58 family)